MVLLQETRSSLDADQGGLFVSGKSAEILRSAFEAATRGHVTRIACFGTCDVIVAPAPPREEVEPAILIVSDAADESGPLFVLGWNDRVSKRVEDYGAAFLSNGGDYLANTEQAKAWSREERAEYVRGWDAASKVIAGLVREV